MLRKLLSTIFMVALIAPMTFAQDGSITGTVTDAETGDVVPTANVILLPIQRGDAADVDGIYLIEDVPSGTYTLRVTFVGYTAYETEVTIEAGQQLTHDVELEQGEIGLDELVVTGYGVESKRELTGSIAKVSSEDFEDVPVQNTAGILQGRAAGVQVTTSSGTAGAGFEVDIRGDGSINAGDDPLWIVDGVQVSFSNQSGQVDESPLNGINPKDIESIEVLKDAAAASIYGAQAANGVILITTKRGQSGETQVSASVQRGARTFVENVEYMNSQQYIQYLQKAYRTSGFGEEAANDVIRSLLPSYGIPANTPFSEVPSTDWFDFITRPGASQTYNMSLSGGNEDTRFYISGAYEKDDDQIKYSGFQRYSLRSNIDHQVSSKFSTRLNLSLSNSKFNGVCQDGYYINCPLSGSTFMLPFTQPYVTEQMTQYNPDLQVGDYSPYFPFIGAGSQPAILFNEVSRNTSTVQIIGDVQATYNFTSWLSLRTQFGMDWRNGRDYRYDNPVARPGQGGTMSEGINTTVNFTTNTVLNFRQTFDEVHNFSGLLGGEYRRDFTRDLGTSGIGFPNELFTVLDAAAEATSTSGEFDEFRIAGYFGNLKYNYDNKYFVNLTARYDGSSRFGADNRWGFFPSVAASWAVSEEDFWNVDAFEDLKIRASYGVTGNSQIGRYAALGLYGLSGSYNGVSGLGPSQLSNPLLTWEESGSVNIGVDYSLWAGRLSGSIDVYRRDNTQLLLNQPLPGDSSFGSITRNIGHVRNEGIEFSFNSVNVDIGDFLWTSRFNFAATENEIMELSEGEDALFPGSMTPYEVGRSQSALNQIRWAGVNPADGRPMWYDENGDITYTPTEADEVERDEDYASDFTGGLGNRLSYKGLTLDFFFQYSFGGISRPSQMTVWGMAQASGSGTNPILEMLTESWGQPGDITPIPSPLVFGNFYHTDTDGYFTGSTNYYWKTNYIRLKNATLSYNLPNSLMDRLGLGNVRLYVTGLNLLTITSFPGYDPETTSLSTAGSIPVARQINGGIEVDF
ncbi:MAG: SusC/RagA family TonB-linked outer membrane protein [Balneolaceae bacterium]|nr:SusC/RagA family TonB-linked outer membrane protein [Balneolaceae bacterium]